MTRPIVPSTNRIASRYFAWMLALAGLSFAVAAAHAAADERFTNHGIAAPSGMSAWGGPATAVDADGTPLIVVHLWAGDYRSLLLIDADTGESEQYDLPSMTGPAGFAMWIADDRYFYTTTDELFVAFDIHEREWFHVEEVPHRMVMNFTEDDDGLLYFGMYPNAELMSFDRKTGTLTNHGPLGEEEWAQYPHLETDDQGWVYAGIRHHTANIYAFNPETEEVHQLLTDEQREEIGYVRAADIRGSDDGAAYIRFRMPEDQGYGDWYRLYDGQIEQVDSFGGSRATWANHPNRNPRRLHDGRSITVNISGRVATIRDTDTDESHEITFDYDSTGVRIYTLETGPDGRIYGSTGNPCHIFRYDPATDEMQDWSFGSGHVNDLTTSGDRIYGAKYSGGELLEFNPFEPWDSLSTSELALFRDEARRELYGRPYTILAHSDGEHVLMGGNPMRSRIGGGMLVYNLETEEPRILEASDLLPDQGVMSLAELPDGRILVGSTAQAPTGGEQVAEHGLLYILSWPELERGETIDPDAGLSVRDLIAAPDGRVFGFTHSLDLFVFDPESEQITDRVSLADTGSRTGGQGPRTLAFGPDGALYALMSHSIVRIDPDTLAYEVVGESPTRINAGIAVHNGRLYFSSDTELWSFQLPAGE